MDGLKSKLKVVPEDRLYKRKLHERRRARQARNSVKNALANKKKLRRETKIRFKRAEEFVRKYRAIERDQQRVESQSKLRHRSEFQIPDTSKLALVVRVKRIDLACEKVKKVMCLLRLHKLNSASFVKLDSLTKQMLNIVQPFVVWGFPTLKTIRELIYKRGCGKVRNRRIPITDNNIIERNLGKYDILCLEDIIHEIFTVGPRFKEVNNFLWPFRFMPSRKTFTKAEARTIADGQFGFRNEKIDDFVMKWN